MIVKFEKEYLEQLYQTGKCGDKKHRFQPQIIKNYHKCVDVLMAAPQIEKLFTFPSLRYEVLSGDKKVFLYKDQRSIPVGVSCRGCVRGTNSHHLPFRGYYEPLQK